MTTPTPRTCGACIAFVIQGEDGDGPRGRCQLRPELGEVSHLLPYCHKYVERGSGARYQGPPVARPRGERRLSDDEEVIIERPKEYGPTIDLGDSDMDTQALRALIRDVLREEGVTGETAIAKKWEGGTIVLKPGAADLQPKEIPIESFFHKVVMLRDRLRVLEQRINANDKLSEPEKIEMQQYVTRIYGSLTTFNVLFRDKDDQFVGQKGE